MLLHSNSVANSTSEPFDSQLSFVLSSAPKQPILDNFFAWKEKREQLGQLIRKSVGNYSLDDSSDEEDVYVEL
jgi:hypothetical protein